MVYQFQKGPAPKIVFKNFFLKGAYKQKELTMKTFFEIENLEPIPANANPFHHDLFNMGQRLGDNVYAMFGNHDTEEMKYLILIDVTTGERVKFVFNNIKK